MPTRFSLLISTHNRKYLLHRSLRAAVRQDYHDYEVIVVDDGSTDGTGEMVAQEFPQVRYVRQEPSQGMAAALNRGIEAATGEIIAFTDDDCLVPPNFLSRLADGYRRYPDVAGVGGYQAPPDDWIKTNVIARYEFHQSHVLYGVRDTEYVGGFECPAGDVNSSSYRKSVLREVRGFDQTFLVNGSAADLKWRITKRGYSLLFVPVKVTHLRSYRWRAFWRQQIRRGIGAAHFEWRRKGRYPRPSRIVLRWAKRTLRFPADLLYIGPSLAFVRLVARWADVCGQYIAWQDYRPRFENPEEHPAYDSGHWLRMV